jgi:hypothetical protein
VKWQVESRDRFLETKNAKNRKSLVSKGNGSIRRAENVAAGDFWVFATSESGDW